VEGIKKSDPGAHGDKNLEESRASMDGSARQQWCGDSTVRRMMHTVRKK
jgi:hypothetical protein